MKELTKEEFVKMVLQEQRRRREKACRKKEGVYLGYLSLQKGKKKYRVKGW